MGLSCTHLREESGRDHQGQYQRAVVPIISMHTMLISRCCFSLRLPYFRVVQHHIVAILYLSAPLALPEFRWFMGACLSVEINTWFLILRRYKRKDRNPMLQEIVSWLFYVSWVAIRCFVYPAIMVVFLQMAHEEVVKTDTLWHWQFIFLPIHFFLCLLNLKWTYDLFEPIVKRCMTWDVDTSSTVSNGL
jgi:hypothetical protein